MHGKHVIQTAVVVVCVVSGLSYAMNGDRKAKIDWMRKTAEAKKMDLRFFAQYSLEKTDNSYEKTQIRAKLQKALCKAEEDFEKALAHINKQR